MKTQHARDVIIEKPEESCSLWQKEKVLQALLPQVVDALKYNGLNILEWSKYVQLILTRRGLRSILQSLSMRLIRILKLGERKTPRPVPSSLEAWPRISLENIFYYNTPRLFGIKFTKVVPNKTKAREFTCSSAKWLLLFKEIIW